MRRRHRLRGLPTFRGPERTLILFDPWLEMWLVTGWDGGEVLVPEADLLAFLEHCGRHFRFSGGPPCQDTRSLVSFSDEEIEDDPPQTEPDSDSETH